MNNDLKKHHNNFNYIEITTKMYHSRLSNYNISILKWFNHNENIRNSQSCL